MEMVEMNFAATINSNSSNNSNSQVKLQVDVQVLKDGGVTTGADLVGSIDQGTSSTRFLVFTAAGKIVASAQMEHQQIFPDGEDKVCSVSVSVSSESEWGLLFSGFVVLIVSSMFALSYIFDTVRNTVINQNRLVGTNTIRSRFGPILSLAFKPSWRRCRNEVFVLPLMLPARNHYID
jgi:hypothetical protein